MLKINYYLRRIFERKQTQQPIQQTLSSEEIPTLRDVGDLTAEILNRAFQSIGAKPERLSIDVLLAKGQEVKDIYLIPGRQRPYISEEQARAELREGESLYRLDVYRVV